MSPQIQWKISETRDSKRPFHPCAVWPLCHRHEPPPLHCRDISDSELHDIRHFSAATRQAHTAAATDAVLDKVTGQLPVKSSQVQVALPPDTTNPAGPDVMLKRPVSVLVMLPSGVSPQSSMQHCHMKVG